MNDMNENPVPNESPEQVDLRFKTFLNEMYYHIGNIGHLLKNVAYVILRLRKKILGLIMLGVPVLYFDEGKLLVLNLVHSITNKGLVDIFILFALGSIIITWCSFALYFIFFK